MKVVWLCHFSNKNIQAKLKLNPRIKCHDFAPWITDTIKQFQNCDDVDLHIVSPHKGMRELIQEFLIDGIHYHFFKCDIPFVHQKYWKLKGIYLNRFVRDKFLPNKMMVRIIMNKIQPDVIHLQGAENPYYSSAILQFNGVYPVVVNLQRMNLDFSFGSTAKALNREHTEKLILSSFRHFGVRTKKMRDDFLTYNNQAITHWMNFAFQDVKPISVPKEYDIVFFGRVCKEKGIEDLLHALSIVRKEVTDVKLCVIGNVMMDYRSYLDQLIKTLDIEGCVTWKGHLPTLKDVHIETSKARICVLPTHYDIIPGTIIESMQLAIPVVSYRTGSIPELNADRENILLCDKGDISGLANNVVKLLSDDSLYRTMANRGLECVDEWFAGESILRQHLECYRASIDDFYELRKSRR